jgi:hypothetical protein
MRTYTADEERTIRAGRLVREWLRSGLITAAQHGRMASGLQLDLRRTNRFLRLTLFGFGLLIIGAAMGLVLITINLREASAGAVCLVGAGVSWALAELLVSRFRVYRFGIEEACAAGAIVLLAVGTALVTAPLVKGAGSVERQLLIALLAAAGAGFAVYRRFGYVHAAMASMACAGLAPFALDASPAVERSIAAFVLAACVVAARVKYRQHGDEYPGDEYRVLQATAALGLYALVNLHLFSLSPLHWFYLPARAATVPFQWLTFALIWIAPAVGCAAAIRDRDRLLLDASLAMGLATLITNKEYLGLARQPWDPILLGLLLIGGAFAIRRWLAAGAGGMRDGITAARILRADKDRVALAGVASGFLRAPAASAGSGPPPDPFKGSGGRAGGGGAEGSF